MSAAPPPTLDRAPNPPVALTIALVVVVVESLVQLTSLFANSGNDSAGFGSRTPGPGGLAILAGSIACKIVLAVRARRLKAGSALGLLALESVGVLAALGSSSWSPAVRIGTIATVILVFALVGSSLHAFPEPDIDALPRTGDRE